MNEVTITVSGPVGSGKSAILGEIEIMCKALGIPVRFADEAAAQAEKNMTHADWIGELQYIKPSVVLIEAGAASAVTATTEEDAARYRWLRDKSQFDHREVPTVFMVDYPDRGEWERVLSGEALDAAIDRAAMAATKEKKQ